MEDLSNVLNSLNEVLANTDLTDVTSEDRGNYPELPDGYYLCEVKSAALKESKSTHMPMVAFDFVIIEDGRGTGDDGSYFDIKKTKNKHIFIYYVLKDSSSVQRFVGDMLKFEGEEPGVSILGKEYFTNSELLEDALDVLVGSRIYIHATTSEGNDGKESHWKNLISWKRASALELN